jgi:AmiR/NasT family two-component response regulator
MKRLFGWASSPRHRRIVVRLAREDAERAMRRILAAGIMTYDDDGIAVSHLMGALDRALEKDKKS